MNPQGPNKPEATFIFEAIVGSQAHGTALPTSDVDVKGVYIQSHDDILGLAFKYRQQWMPDKDTTYYEIRRFIDLLIVGNPTTLELLFSPEDCIRHTSLEFELLREHRKLFLTKLCKDSFGGYAIQQITKARGLDKKMNWEVARVERKTVLDFCYVVIGGQTKPVIQWLQERELNQKYCGLVALNHMEYYYALYYDFKAAAYPGVDYPHFSGLGYRGLATPKSMEVLLSSVPKGADPITTMYWNKNAWSQHCRDYHQYQQWLLERNEQRYVDTGHGQRIDGKNMMHCSRLLSMAIELANTGELNIRRPDREYLLSIRKGEVDLAKLIEDSQLKIKEMDAAFDASNLPTTVDQEVVNEIAIRCRKIAYDINS